MSSKEKICGFANGLFFPIKQLCICDMKAAQGTGLTIIIMHSQRN